MSRTGLERRSDDDAVDERVASRGDRAVLTPVASISRRHAAITQIRRGILLGALRPGEKLTEIALAASLQVSRATVREALGQLAQEGLLVAEPYRGLRVTSLDDDAIRDLAQTRLALDGLAIEAILDDRSGRRLTALRVAWTAYDVSVDDLDPVLRHDAHVAFHRAIWSAAENGLLNQLWPIVEAHMTIALAEDQRVRPSPARSRAIHADVVDAVVSGDRERIQQALRAHTVEPAEDLIAFRRNHDQQREHP